MKRFDFEAIKQRITERMLTSAEWRKMSSNGAVSALINAFAYGLDAESRYMEYLLAEKKWKHAQNPSSIRSQLDLISAQPKRMRSATGIVIVSHTDNEGNNRLANFGSSFFNLDEASNFDDLVKDPDPQIPIRTQTLVPWTYPTTYNIPRGTRFLTDDNTEYIAVETVTSRSLKEPWSVIKSSSNRFDAWLASGGWEGIKYLRVPVIQGRLESSTLGVALGTRFETMVLNVRDCEEADTSFSREFLSIFVNTTGDPNMREEWIRIPNVLLAGPYDKTYQVINGINEDEVYIKFGDGTTGMVLPAGAVVSIEYLETTGASGNTSNKGAIKKIIFPTGREMIDPRTQAVSQFLYATNTTPLVGGRDHEGLEETRERAPASYLEHHTISDSRGYRKAIIENSPIGLHLVDVFPSVVYRDLNGFKIETNVIAFTAITASGLPLSSEEESAINQIVLSLGDNSSPTDRLSYIQPNTHRLRLGVLVAVSDPSVTRDGVTTTLAQALLDVYSVFNRGFKTPFYRSNLIQIAQSFPFSSFVDVVVEAHAKVELAPSNIRIDGGDGRPDLLSIRFKFDAIYGQDSAHRGFKNFRSSFLPLLKLDLTFPNDAIKNTQRSRSFILFDNRAGFIGEPPDLAQGKWLYNTGESVVGNGELDEPWLRPDETLETFITRTVRVAQYPLINQVMTEAFVTGTMLNKTVNPNEIRPFVFDAVTSRNSVFDSSLVDSDLRVLLPGGTTANKRDSRWVDFVDISFVEDYEYLDSPSFASGVFTIPLDFLGLRGVSIKDEVSLLNALKDQVSISIVAQPLANNLTPLNNNEIIYVDESDITIDVITP